LEKSRSQASLAAWVWRKEIGFPAINKAKAEEIYSARLMSLLE
jgi:hypothetical protein